jgi:putative transcriptional regulator
MELSERMNIRKGKISNRIRELRTSRGWSQGELAERVDATRQTINAIAQEKYAPSLELAFRITGAFGVGFEDVWQFS